MSEADRRRNIVLSYMRDGMSEGNAVRAADELMGEMEARRLTLAEQRTFRHALVNFGEIRQTMPATPLNKEEGAET